MNGAQRILLSYRPAVMRAQWEDSSTEKRRHYRE